MAVAQLLISTPQISTGRLPKRAIRSEAGSVVIIDVRNCRDSGNVASHAMGARSTPTSAVLMMFTFIVVIDSACATARRTTVRFCETENIKQLER